MAEDLYDRYGDILHEVPELEDPLREYRRRVSLAEIRRRLARDHTEILVRSMAGHPPYVDHRD